MRTKARFPELGEKAGHYESFYVKLTHPSGGLGVWLRHTVHKRPGADPTGSIWLTLFDREADGPLATKLTVPAAELDVPAGRYVRVDGATIGPVGLSGEISTEALDARWDLSIRDLCPPLHHLPYGLLYSAPIPRTKLLSPHPGAVFSGSMVIGDRNLDIDGWPGMIGHNWGAEHAARWTWIHAPEIDGEPGTYLDIGAGRVALGRWTTPWIANGMLRLAGGEEIRLGGLDKFRATRISESPTSCEFEIPGAEGAVVRGRVSAPRERFVGWVYADPDGPEHNTVNCSICDLELTLESRTEHRTLSVAAAAAYELGMHETNHGIPLQPFPDG